MDNTEIAQRLGVGRIQVGRWRERFAEGGLAAIAADLPRSGRKPRIDAAEIVRLTTQTTPAATTHWSTRSLDCATSPPSPIGKSDERSGVIPHHSLDRQAAESRTEIARNAGPTCRRIMDRLGAEYADGRWPLLTDI